VGNGPEGELNRVDRLVNDNLSHLKLLLVLSSDSARVNRDRSLFRVHRVHALRNQNHTSTFQTISAINGWLLMAKAPSIPAFLFEFLKAKAAEENQLKRLIN
jgi:hypothetical protein